MKIVIDIPAEDFEKVKCGRGAVSMMRKAIIHGTPLPDTNVGELISRQALQEWIKDKTFGDIVVASEHILISYHLSSRRSAEIA